MAEIEKACKDMLGEDGKVKCADVAKALGVKCEKIVKRLTESQSFKLEKDGKCWFAMLG